MLAYDLKAILEIVPEAMPLVKKANLEQDFPVDSKDSYIASMLRVKYLTKVAHTSVDYDAQNLLDKAGTLYNASEELAPMLEKLEKYAELKVLAQRSLEDSIASTNLEFYNSISGLADLEKAASIACKAYDLYGEEGMSDEMLKYAGVGFLHKEAAVKGMIARYQASKNPMFVKLARMVSDVDETSVTRGDILSLASTVTSLEKEANLQLYGFNFYKDCIVKSASSVLEISIAGQKVPYETIARLGKDRIATVVGKEVADELKNDPVNDKHVLESLPLDLQKILLSIIKSV